MAEVTQFKSLSHFPELVHGVATASFGNMSYRFGEPDQVRSNRATFFDQLHIPEGNVVVASLLHGHQINDVGETEHGRGIAKAEESLVGDILVADKPETYLFMVVADCLAILFFEPKVGVVALAHAGWRGVDQEVPKITVDHLVEKYSCDPAKIIVGLSPALQAQSSVFTQPEHFDVTNRDKWRPYVTEVGGQFRADWVRFAVDQLVEVGVKKGNIENEGIDTLTDKNYFSHRRSVQQKQSEARFGCLIGLKK